MERDYGLLKEILSVPTKTYQEDLMVEFLINWLEQNGIPFNVDEHNNIYAVKQTDEFIDYFPCVIAHTDTVHSLDNFSAPAWRAVDNCNAACFNALNSKSASFCN